jgi:deazaflavin-dependent oxidoreductase (nitroreductase family)
MTADVDNAARRAQKASKAPRFVSMGNPFLKPLLARGVPVGPNVLITIKGRTSGEPRTTPVAIIEVDGHRWIWSPWGEVHWALNLRAAGRATITVRRNHEEVTATELDEGQRLAFYRDTFIPYARAMRGGAAFVRLIDGVSFDDPAEIAARTTVFELHATTPRA